LFLLYVVEVTFHKHCNSNIKELKLSIMSWFKHATERKNRSHAAIQRLNHNNERNNTVTAAIIDHNDDSDEYVASNNSTNSDLLINLKICFKL